MKTTFILGDKEFTSKAALAKELGLSKITEKQFDKYGVTVKGSDDSVATTEDTSAVSDTAEAVETAETNGDTDETTADDADYCAIINGKCEGQEVTCPDGCPVEDARNAQTNDKTVEENTETPDAAVARLNLGAAIVGATLVQLNDGLDKKKHVKAADITIMVETFIDNGDKTATMDVEVNGNHEMFEDGAMGYEITVAIPDPKKDNKSDKGKGKGKDDKKTETPKDDKASADVSARESYKTELKEVSDADIFKMTKAAGLNDYKDVTHAGIRRMRCIMQLVDSKCGKAPNTRVAQTKVESPYASKTNEELAALAESNKLEVAPNSHAHIYRMRLIMELKKVKH